MATEATTSARASEISVGDALPDFDLPVTSTVIVAGAIASPLGISYRNGDVDETTTNAS